MGVTTAMKPDMRPVRAVIALGGNLGDVPAAFAGARAMLDTLEGTDVLAISPCYVSPPLGPPGQPDYRNAVLMVRTRLSPHALLECLQRIEHAWGRTRSGERWGPRTLDLDLIAHHDAVMRTASLTLPHPRMHKRMFVLQPLCDIWPEWRHPWLKRTARELMDALRMAGASMLPPGSPW